ncbi:RecT family recombinase [Prevotella amnii]|uniref:RecT family recombinase n=1 Tax=Prevotella amnii TaxID=419005 RepID=UPI00068F69D4|nr:RecT family recombinase [Prevotella amnii]
MTETKKVEKQPLSQNQTMLTRTADNISQQVLQRVSIMQKAGEIALPKGYEAGNALKSAWLYLQNVQTRDKQKAIDACTKESIANCLLDMVVRGEHPMQHCYFIPTGNQLSFWERYTGKLMRAKRDTDIASVNAQVVYEADNFVYTVDDKGILQLVKHETSMANMDNAKIVGAYAVVVYKNGSTRLEVMTMDMIRKAWGQGAARGNSGAHLNFTDQMAKKTVIARACKIELDSTEDGHNDDEAFMAQPKGEVERDIANDTSVGVERVKKLNIEHHDDFEDSASYEEIKETPQSENKSANDLFENTQNVQNTRKCPI